jgi:hypothetical protein
MAEDRAPTIATTIHASTLSSGRPSDATSNPINAKGIAKTVCSHLII